MSPRAATIVLAVLLGAPASAASQVPPAAPPAPAATQPQAAPLPPQVILERESAQQVRQELHQMLRQLPPEIGEILQRDPTLARPDYLAAYPTFVAYLQQHPEIARNPSFFFGSYRYRDPEPTDRSYQVFRDVMDGISVLVVITAMIGTLVWLIRTVVDQRRWLRVARTQSEVHGKLLDRLTSNEDLLAYIQTAAGRRYLESGPLLAQAEPSRTAGAPLSRILLALQAGVVLVSLGVGFWIVQRNFPEDMTDGFTVMGTLMVALGIGFTLAAAVSYVISSRYGLVAPPVHTHD